MATDSQYFVVDNETLQSFGELDYRIYNTIHQYGQRLLDVRVADLAHDAHTSNAAVVRFCKKCGYSGLKELKSACALKMRKQHQSDPLPSVITDLRTIIDEEGVGQYQQDIMNAFRLIQPAHGIVLVGHGRSAGLAVYGANLLSDMEYAAIPLISFPAYIPDTIKGGAALVISHRGSTPEVVAQTNEISSKGYDIIALTSRPDSPIARMANVCICYGDADKSDLNPFDFSTRIPALHAIEQLARLLYNDRIL